MSKNIHQTTANEYSGPEGRGWEFSCPHCDYQARYLLDEALRENKLVILNEGITGARHVGSLPPAFENTRPARVVESQAGENGDLKFQDVVPPYLVAQIEEIISRAGF